MDHFINKGYVDSFRYFFPDSTNKYTWWSYRFNARMKNIGWRIDYFCVNKEIINRVKKAEILSDIYGSDHCPIGLEFE